MFSYIGVKGLHIECDQKHWMNNETMVRWMHFIRLQMIGKGYRKVAVIVDSASQHLKDNVIEYCASTHDTECAIHILFIQGGLTSILQPCDVYVNKIVKDLIKLALRWLRATRRVGGDSDAAYKVGTFRAELALVVCATFAILNTQQKAPNHKHRQGIARAFKMCGLDPSEAGTAAGKDMPLFEDHINKLKRSPCYSNLATASNRQVTADDAVRPGIRRWEVPVSQQVPEDRSCGHVVYGFAPSETQLSTTVATAQPTLTSTGCGAASAATSGAVSSGARGRGGSGRRGAAAAATRTRGRIVGVATHLPRAHPCVPHTLDLRCDAGRDSAAGSSNAPHLRSTHRATAPPSAEAEPSPLTAEQVACAQELHVHGVEEDTLILALAHMDSAVEGLLDAREAPTTNPTAEPVRTVSDTRPLPP
eukprot:GHVU01107322.1.p1 GENE.GHVU01107322.1~~GHVU01107322.1.p1  ORF type:complete len:420 (-),score=31.49 GHVU01107322.1:865-2124(-)